MPEEDSVSEIQRPSIIHIVPFIADKADEKVNAERKRVSVQGVKRNTYNDYG